MMSTHATRTGAELPTQQCVSATVDLSSSPDDHARRSLIDRGIAGLDAVMAVGLAAVVAAALLSVTTSMTAQARQAGVRDEARAIASQVLAASSAAGCGLAVGTEAAAWLTAHAARCAAILAGGDATSAGDMAGSSVRAGVEYRVVVHHRWLRAADGGENAAECADLAQVPPRVLERRVEVVRLGADERSAVSATDHEHVPVDTVAHTPAVGVIVAGLTAGDVVELVTDGGAGVRLRRTAVAVGDGDHCVWFPFVADTTVHLARAGEAPIAVVVPADGVSVAGAAL